MFSKYIFVSLLLIVTEYSFGDVALDYYFGFDDSPLRAADILENCNTNNGGESCQKICGPNHACLLGKCFCVKMKPQVKYEVIQKLLQKYKKNNNYHSSYEDSSSEYEPLTQRPRILKMKAASLRPSLRHHIAHFCPNLDIARQCIMKCMQVGKPAFCGKDHVCYCGHNYNKLKTGSGANKTYDAAGFWDSLYEKYFGPTDRPKFADWMDM